MTRSDRWIGALLIGLAAMIMYQAATMDYHQFSNDPGPALIPKIISVGLFLSGLGLLLWPRKKTAAPQETKQKEAVLRMQVIALSFLVYTIVMAWIGFVFSTFLFTSFAIWFLAKERSRKTLFLGVATSAVVTGCLYLTFVKLLNTVLPSGLL